MIKITVAHLLAAPNNFSIATKQLFSTYIQYLAITEKHLRRKMSLSRPSAARRVPRNTISSDAEHMLSPQEAMAAASYAAGYPPMPNPTRFYWEYCTTRGLKKTPRQDSLAAATPPDSTEDPSSQLQARKADFASQAETSRAQPTQPERAGFSGPSLSPIHHVERYHGNAPVPVPDLSDLPNASNKGRAAHFLFRTIVAQPADTKIPTPNLKALGPSAQGGFEKVMWLVPQDELYNMYKSAVMESAKGNIGKEHAMHGSLLSPDEFMSLVPKLYKGAEVLGHEFLQGVGWKSGPTGEDLTKKMESMQLKEVNSASFLVGHEDHGTNANVDEERDKQYFLYKEEAKAKIDIDPYDEHEPAVMKLTLSMLLAGRKLAHLPEPSRTYYWLKMFYTTGINVETSESSLWMHYERTFGIYNDDASVDSHLDDTWLVKMIHRLYDDLEETETAPGVFVIWGLKPRKRHLFSADIITRYSRTQESHVVKRLERWHYSGVFQPPLRIEEDHDLNKFQMRLFIDPLLPLPADRVGPVTQRLRNLRSGLKHGDHQPGFPGTSMKLLQRQCKVDYEEWLEDEMKSEEEREAARMNQQVESGSSSAANQAASGDHVARKDKGKGKQPANAAVDSTPSPRSQSHTPKSVSQNSARSGPTPSPGTILGAHHSLKEVVKDLNKQNDCQHGPKQTIVPVVIKKGPQKSVVAPNRRPTNVVGEDHRESVDDDDGYEEAAAAAAANATGESSRAPMQATVESGSESDA
ncbi:hypothetical protein KC343_g5345 [Hortaea werneckii]|nr:hypothetical protein KC352_g11972 [Hortaea werneckii]KAI7566536.1 hypothetical protein KC317_g5604 [Hortaea werneckii]KAI7618037.1 hypothetical protein KC346_g5208 [Hortaea werneckii]KAI7629235.1 hypothetical protein KC343_g5345 [Hortaea werneckii]KAI7679051.1 hypothetical protein KC319_g2967 [Hortaea werneckii]